MTNIARAERIRFVGASESAALFGVHPYCTRFKLYHQKRGTLAPEDLDDSERIQAGQFMEPAIAAWAAFKWSMPVHRVKEYLLNPNIERMGASLDFANEDDEPVEIKNVDASRFREIEDWLVEGDTLADAPAHMLIQVTHQLSCKPKARRGWLIACVGGNRLFRMEVPRHDAMIARLEQSVRDFWVDVDAGNEPSPDYSADAWVIAMLYGGKGDEMADLRANERAAVLAREYFDVGRTERESRNHKNAVLAELKTLLEDARGAMLPEGFTLKAVHVPGGTTTREPHWRFNLTQQKKPTTKE